MGEPSPRVHGGPDAARPFCPVVPCTESGSGPLGTDVQQASGWGKDPLKPPRRGREQALPDLWEEAMRDSGVESEHLPPGEDGDTEMSDV